VSKTPQSAAADSAARREHLRHNVHHYLNLPVALAAILFVLIAFTHISGTGTVPWRRHFWHGPSVVLLWLIWAFFLGEFVAKFALAPHKPTYLRRHWVDALVALLPVCGVLRLIEVVLISPLIRVVRGEKPHPHLAILAKRKLDKLALTSVLVILIAACLAYIFENGAKGSPIQTFGDALWWAAATATTVGNQLYPVTIPGEILAFALMLFAIGVFSYLTSSLASALIGGDADETAKDSDRSDTSSQDQGAQGSPAPAQPGAKGVGPANTASAPSASAAAPLSQPSHNGAGSVTLSPDEIAALRALLDRVARDAS
jgi:voltage-gated potassium channel